MFSVLLWKAVRARRLLTEAIMANEESRFDTRKKKPRRPRVCASSTDSSDDQQRRPTPSRKKMVNGNSKSTTARTPEQILRASQRTNVERNVASPANAASDSDAEQNDQLVPGKKQFEDDSLRDSGTVTDRETETDYRPQLTRHRKLRRYARRSGNWSSLGAPAPAAVGVPRFDYVNTSEAEAEQSDIRSTQPSCRSTRKSRIREFLSEKTGKTVARTVRICGRLLEISRLPPTLKRLVKHRLRREELRESASRFRVRSPLAMLFACVVFSLTILLPLGAVLNWLRRMSLRPESEVTNATSGANLSYHFSYYDPGLQSHAAQFDDYISTLREGVLLPTVKDMRFRKALERRFGNLRKAKAPPDAAWNVFGIDRRSNLTVAEFVEQYDAIWPVIVTDCVPKWPAYAKWTRDYLVNRHGNAPVTVKSVSCVSGSCKTEASVESLRDFAEYLDRSATIPASSWRYLQDELFVESRADLLADVDLHTPKAQRNLVLPAGDTSVCGLLQGGLFDLLPETIRPWRALMLWGSANSRSTLHIDPYNWTGTVALLSGKKRWILVPPGQEFATRCQRNVHTFDNTTCPPKVDSTQQLESSSIDCYTVPAICVTVGESHFPLNCNSYVSTLDLFASNSTNANCAWDLLHAIEVEQRPGDVLIVPSGWFHQALNVETSLAISGEMLTDANHLAVLTEALKRNPEIEISLADLMADRGRSIVQLSDAEVKEFHRPHSVVRDRIAARTVRRFAERIPESIRQRGLQMTRAAFEAYEQNARSRN